MRGRICFRLSYFILGSVPLTFFDIYVFIWKNRINFAEFFRNCLYFTLNI